MRTPRILILTAAFLVVQASILVGCDVSSTQNSAEKTKYIEKTKKLYLWVDCGDHSKTMIFPSSNDQYDVRGGDWSVHQEKLTQADQANGIVRKVKVSYMPSLVRDDNSGWGSSEWYDWSYNHEAFYTISFITKESGEEIVDGYYRFGFGKSWEKEKVLHCE